MRSMETVYRVIWKPRYKKLGISTTFIIRTALYEDQEKINYKYFYAIRDYSYKD